VLANKKLRVGTHTSATKLYMFISFGFGLKDSLAKGTIKVNPHGKVPVVKGNPVIASPTRNASTRLTSTSLSAHRLLAPPP
jgi:hypothetical protein